ncbi:MAG: isocitrate/isopropylmalate dehydrogenase family protein [Sneathiella sp.]|uniref:isocitrate/isopropylmalate dehydrogenase family protein n=1 Tax=Sneathiella sp. TaxID=1964365 RepID=UPI003002C04A
MTNLGNSFKIAVFEGDGIGPEITRPTMDILKFASSNYDGFSLDFEILPAGAGHYRDTGTALPKESMDRARAADAILLSAIGLPDVRYEDGTEIRPQVDLRFDLGLYAGVRPVKVFPGANCPLSDPRAKDIDFVLVRESTEGLFAHMHDGKVVDDQYATETLRITRDTSEKLFDFSFFLAQQRASEKGRPGKVTCVDKANIFRSFWFFRSIFEERAKFFPDVAADAAYVDAMAMWMVQRPWEFDVLVTENMFGDILSDLGAGIMGSLGLAPSADIGDDHAVFQPCHGSAPDIAGQGIANPLAMILSAGMMLTWLGHQNASQQMIDCGQSIDDAVTRVLAQKKGLTRDLGGQLRTEECAIAVLDAFQSDGSEGTREAS